MAKKMCPHYYTGSCATITKRTRAKWCKRSNGECEIVPKKPKVRRIKAWAFVFMGKTGRVQIDAYSDRNISHKGLRPCTILIEEKYLKEKNNAR